MVGLVCQRHGSKCVCGCGAAVSSACPANEFHAEIVYLFDWFNIPSAGFHIPWAIQVDTLSVTMMLVVTGVGSLIHIYAIGYMHGDPNFSRFFAYFNLFIFFMLILVSGQQLFDAVCRLGRCGALFVSC